MFGFMDIVAAILFLLIGLLLVCAQFYQIYIFRSTNWETTYGKIINSNVKENYNRRSDAASAWMYKPIVEYEFDINKLKYSSNVINVGDDFHTNSQHGPREIVERYPKGMTVKVFYDSEDPNISCLEKKISGGFYFVFAFGLAFIVIGSLLLHYKMN